MRLPNNFAALLALALGSAGWAGCQTHTTVLPLKDGYEEVAHPYHALIDEPPPPRIAFQYRDAGGAVTPLWPSLYGVNEVIHDGVAIFVGDKAYVEPDRMTRPRLFAVKPPELPLDITDEVLQQWAKANDKKFAAAEDRLTMVTPEAKNGGLELRLDFWLPEQWADNRQDWPQQGSLLLDWRQVGEIMSAVKTNGAVEKDLRWHSSYIGEKF